MIYRIIIISFLFSVQNISFAQIEITKETTKKEKKKKTYKAQKEKSYDGATSVFLTSNWSFTNRRLIENDGGFGDSLGPRADETGLGAWSFGLGLRNQFHEKFAWEGGVSYTRNGEKYSFSNVDTSYSYETKYSYIAMPIKILFTHGDKVKLLIGGGIVPQMFMRYDQQTSWNGPIAKTGIETLKLNNGFSTFVLSAVVNAGVQVKLGGRWSALFVPEYKIQLISSYDNYDDFKHFGRSLGFNFGVAVQL